MRVKKPKRKDWFKSNALLLVVFATGACVLILEVLATRILSPYFGNTIYSFSSILGVILAALSFGYYFGGILADKNPEKKLFYKIILLSGVFTLILKIINNYIVPAFAYKISFLWGPLIISLVLFALPAFFLGILSPFAIALQKKNLSKKGVGQIAGEVFFASTLGSIFGSFLCGYFLVPNFGVSNIVQGVGLLLILIGTVGMAGYIKFTNKLFLNLFLVLSIILFAKTEPNLSANVVYSKDGVYEKLTVVDSIYNGKYARVLLQDTSSSSAIYPNEPNKLAFEYTNYYKLYKLFNPSPAKALFIGGGAYTMPSDLIKETANTEVDVVEIEPELYEISKNYFNASDDQRLKNHITDGRRFLTDTDKKYDIIFSDVYASIYSIPVHFTTKEFFELAKSKLSEDGIFFANIISDLSRQQGSFFMHEAKTFKNAFPNSYIFATETPSGIRTQNMVFVGLNNDVDLINLLNNSEDTFFQEIVAKIIDTNRFALDGYEVLTDNYAPVEVMTAGFIKRNYDKKDVFAGAEAKELAAHQLVFGPRYLGSDGSKKVRQMISSELSSLGGETQKQTFEKEFAGEKTEFTNIISRFSPENKKRIILGTHFDTKKNANLNSYDKNSPVPGANDGASGVSVLLELARVIKEKQEKPNVGIDFVFFDGEEGVEGTTWYPIGSTYFSENLESLYPNEKPQGAVIIDMVCDTNLNIYTESNSLKNAGNQTKKIMEIASKMYPDNFSLEEKYAVWDDHSPLNEKGVLSTLLIDFEYPHFHTANDTLDKCSASSLEKVGNVLLEYIYSF